MEEYLKNITVSKAKAIAKKLSDSVLLQAIEKTKGEVCEVFMQEYDRRHQEPCDSCRM